MRVLQGEFREGDDRAGRRRRRRAGVLRGRAGRGGLRPPSRLPTGQYNQSDGRSDARQASQPARRRPGDRKLTPRAPARASTMWYVLGLPAAAGARPGVLLLGPVRRDALLQRVPQGRSATARSPSSRSATTASAARSKPADDGKPRTFTTVRVEDPKLVEDLEAQRRQVHRRGDQPVDRRDPRLGHPAHLPRRRCGASSSGGWAAPRAA